MNDVEGLKELQRSLKRIKNPRVADNIVRAGTRQGAKFIADEAESILVSATGAHNRRKITYQRDRRQSGKYVNTYRIGPKVENWELNFLEYGVPPHIIKPKKKALTIHVEEEGFGGELFSAKADHPGIPRIAFMRKAAALNIVRVAGVMKGKMWQRLRKELNK